MTRFGPRWWRLSVAALLLVFAACHPAADRSRSPRRHDGLEVFVSVLPQKVLTERIAGPEATVRVMIGPGESPATYEPSPRQMGQLSQASLLLTIGAPFERSWAPRVATLGGQLLLRDVSREIERLPMPADHGHEEDGELDPHIWLDPLRLSQVARNTASALAEVDPSHADEYRRRAEELSDELSALDAELGELLRPIEGSTLLVFHPSWGYFASRYGLEQLAVESRGRSPGPRGMVELLERARARGVRFVLVQRQFDSGAVRALAAELGVPVLAADPLAEDLPGELRRLARSLVDTSPSAQKRQTTLR